MRVISLICAAWALALAPSVREQRLELLSMRAPGRAHYLFERTVLIVLRHRRKFDPGPVLLLLESVLRLQHLEGVIPVLLLLEIVLRLEHFETVLLRSEHLCEHFDVCGWVRLVELICAVDLVHPLLPGGKSIFLNLNGRVGFLEQLRVVFEDMRRPSRRHPEES